MKPATQKARQQLILALKITGLSSNALSKQTGVADTTLSRLEKSDNPPEPRVSTVEGIDLAVHKHIASGDATEEQVAIYEKEYLPLQGVRSTPYTEPQTQSVVPAQIERNHMSDFQTDPRTIPVMGTAAGSALGSFEIGSDIIDRVRCPPNLVGIKGIYGIVVVGESMVPEHKPGDLRIIHPGRPPQPGDSVVIQTYNAATDTREAFIKILVKANGKEVKCRQHNPPMEITYIQPNGDPEKNNGKQTYVLKVHKVLTVNELHGF
ncbi:S24 family peptidase [Cohaesibacter celericrescens]|nr:helix-turn-helix transcriptional regulator [Cohaesibacter celericrescens]